VKNGEKRGPKRVSEKMRKSASKVYDRIDRFCPFVIGLNEADTRVIFVIKNDRPHLSA